MPDTCPARGVGLLTAALIGLALALALRHFDTAPRKHYAWEGEEERESGAPSQAGEDS